MKRKYKISFLLGGLVGIMIQRKLSERKMEKEKEKKEDIIKALEDFLDFDHIFDSFDDIF